MRRPFLNRPIRKWIGEAICCLLFLPCPVLVHASTGLSLKMADAVYERINKTYRIRLDGSYQLTLHFKVKILTYKGKKDHADFKYPYNTAYQTVHVVGAETVTANGKVLPVDKKEIHDINDPRDARASIYSKERVKVVNFPSVEPGASVELTLEVESKRGFWAVECFKLGDPVIQKVVTVLLPGKMALNVKEPVLKVEHEVVHKGKETVYRWTAHNVPKQIEEPMLPPPENSGNCLFLSTFTGWKDVAAYFRKMLPEKPVEEGKRRFRAKTPDQLYVSFMKRFFVYPLNLFHTSFKFQTPLVTLRKGYGCQADLALLFYGLLKSRGYKPELLMMNSGDAFVRDFAKMPTPVLFDDVLVRCDGVDYAFYAKELPPGFNGLQGEWVLDLEKGKLLPAYQRYMNRSATRMTLMAKTDSSLKGRFVFRSEGRQANLVRTWLRYKTKDEWRIAVSQIFHNIDPIAQPVGKLQCKGLNTLVAPMILKGRFRIPRPFPANGNWSFVTIGEPDLPSELKTLLETRHGPLMIRRNYEESLGMKIFLPEGVKVLSAPPLTRGSIRAMDWAYGIKSLRHSAIIKRVIHLKRTILFPGTREYHRLIKAISTLYRPSNRLVILECVPQK